MQCQRSYDTTVIKKQNIDTKTENNITYNYKRRREELNAIVGRHIKRQKQKSNTKEQFCSCLKTNVSAHPLFLCP